MKNNVVAPALLPPPSPRLPRSAGRCSTSRVKIRRTSWTSARTSVGRTPASPKTRLPSATPSPYSSGSADLCSAPPSAFAASTTRLPSPRRRAAFDGWDASEALRQAKKMRDDRVVCPPPSPHRTYPRLPRSGSSPNPRLSRGPGDAPPRSARVAAELRGDDGEAIAPSKPSTFLDRWASGLPRTAVASDQQADVSRRYDAQLLVRMYETEADETSAAARRNVKRRVVFTTPRTTWCCTGARDEPGQWLAKGDGVARRHGEGV